MQVMSCNESLDAVVGGDDNYIFRILDVNSRDVRVQKFVNISVLYLEVVKSCRNSNTNFVAVLYLKPYEFVVTICKSIL